jgi:hypothetical protein
MPKTEFASYNVVALFPDAGSAANALSALIDAGIGAEELSYVASQDDPLLHPKVDEASRDPREAGKRIATGAGGGAAAGGALGALAGAAVIGLPGIGVAIGAGALFAGAAGAAIGAQTTAGEEEWKQRLAPLLRMVDEGNILVGVHVDEEERIEDAEAVLEERSPSRMERIRTRGGKPDAG